MAANLSLDIGDAGTICNDVCVEGTAVVISVLGLVCGIIALVLYLYRKKIHYMPKNVIVAIIGILAVLFFLFAIQFVYYQCGGGCDSGGTSFDIQLLPEQPLPISLRWIQSITQN